ncbi:MAG TPA: hypothetical protein VHE35_25450 [Kofleriaceae bacterium]|nr:hypothetical protein [Kofleriaceae bacterium]
MAGLALRDQRADACGWSAPTIEEVTTFDPLVSADPTPESMQFDPYYAGFGGPCADCAHASQLSDWDGFLGGAVPRADWEKILYQASADDLRRIAGRVGSPKAPAGKPGPLPLGLDLAHWKTAAKAKILAALDYVALARGTEALASEESSSVSPAEAARLLAAAKAGLKATREPFLAQRYAFQVVRVSFYQHDWGGVVDFFDKNSARLAGPSADLAARARYYAAGALRHGGNLARANLELARVAADPDLVTVAAQDFQPMEETDWKAALRLAHDVHEQVALWRLIGLNQDGIVAAQEIAKLDPTSKVLGLLIVRELGKAEAHGDGYWSAPADPAAEAARQKAYASLEAVTRTILAARGADRPWLLRLVLGHLAARRGDVATARTMLQTAVTARPGDVRVAAQAKASLAIALVMEGKLDAAHEDEIAKTMDAIDPGFSRREAVTHDVRTRLAAAYLKAGRIVDAEFLSPGSVDPVDPMTGAPKSATSKWFDPAFLRDMIARAAKNTNAFDHFVLEGSYTKQDLERELAMRQLLNGDFTGAAKTYASTDATSAQLGTDPFQTHVVDCHDCDHATYANAPWTHGSFVAHMADLARQASGKGDPAARAALDLGTGFYNLTWYGNARVVLDGTHQMTRDPKLAERWYKRAFDLASDRELKAKAAFYAAKAELGEQITAASPEDPYGELETLPVPTTWYPVLETLSDTAYYKEVLAECGTFQQWASTKPARH